MKAVAMIAAAILMVGCGGKSMTKEQADKAIKDALGSEWKQTTVEAKGEIGYAVGSMRSIKGKDYWFNFSGGGASKSGGVAVRTPDNKMLCKYLFTNGKEESATKLDAGTDDDVKNFRDTAKEFADVIIKATS